MLRSTFVVGFPGETEADFQFLLDWLDEAQLDRVGAFAYEDVQGAAANALPDHVPEEVKQERRERFMLKAGAISTAKLKKKVGQTLQVLVDEVRPDGVAVARSRADAPEIDGNVFVKGARLQVGDFAEVRVTRTAAYDLWAEPATGGALRSAPMLAPRRPGMRRIISRI